MKNVLISTNANQLISSLLEDGSSVTTAKSPKIINSFSQSGIFITAQVNDQTQPSLITNQKDNPLLVVQAKEEEEEEVISFQLQTFDSSLRYSLVPYSLGAIPVNNLSQPTYKLEDSEIYLPKSPALRAGDVKEQTKTNYLLDVSVKEFGTSKIHLDFMIIDNASGQKKGYFRWIFRIKTKKTDITPTKKSVINILIVLDAELLSQVLGTKTKSAKNLLVKHKGLVTLFSQDEIEQNRNLTINARKGDTIQFTSITLDNDMSFSSFIVSATTDHSVLEEILINEKKYETYLPKNTQKLSGDVDKNSQTKVFAETTVLESNKKVTINFSNTLINNTTGEKISNFNWTMALNIVESK